MKWLRLFVECKIEKVRWHDIRHTYSSLLHNQGLVNLKAISNFMGHHSPKFTLDSYIAEEEVIYDMANEIDDYAHQLNPSLTNGRGQISTINEENIFSDEFVLDIFS